MPEQYLYEYALIRVVPRVEREEFLNVGVILFCAKKKFLKLNYTLNSTRLHAIAPQLDLEELEEHLKAMSRICSGAKDAGTIGRLDLPSRFRWLTATRSTVIQPSKVHPGFCENADLTLEKLHQSLVL
ncbi:DUF3037 domain-containing protein [Pedobacter sp.]|uniref:DUF3037 domain-containing protein n=1 Tax=Pedobacter sp. TaxID=1411316 RepID=UPI003D7F41A0